MAADMGCLAVVEFKLMNTSTGNHMRGRAMAQRGDDNEADRMARHQLGGLALRPWMEVRASGDARIAGSCGSRRRERAAWLVALLVGRPQHPSSWEPLRAGGNANFALARRSRRGRADWRRLPEGKACLLAATQRAEEVPTMIPRRGGEPGRAVPRKNYNA